MYKNSKISNKEILKPLGTYYYSIVKNVWNIIVKTQVCNRLVVLNISDIVSYWFYVKHISKELQFTLQYVYVFITIFIRLYENIKKVILIIL